MSISKRRLLTAIFMGGILVTALLSWLWPRPTPRYTIIDLGVLPGYAESSSSGINSRGDVVGISLPQPGTVNKQHSFLYHNGRMTDLGLSNLLGGPAINDKGQVTGNVALNGRKGRPFLYSGNQMRDLGYLSTGSMGFGNSINGRGQIVGEEVGQNAIRAFLYENGQIRTLAASAGNQDSDAESINSSGQIAVDDFQSNGRTQGFLYDSRTKTRMALAAPPGSLGTFAAGLNDSGQIAGSVSFPKQEHAALWNGIRMTDLGTLPGLDISEASAINNLRQVVGAARAKQGLVAQFINQHAIGLRTWFHFADPDKASRAFLYERGKMQELNDLLPTHSGWVLEEANAINDRGQIVGRGLHDGKERAFLLTPR